MIPKIIHQIWIGDINYIPLSQINCIKSCKSIYKDFTYYFWTLNKIKEFNYFNDNKLKFLINNIKNKQFLNIKLKDNTYNVLINDILRFKILYEFGGIYFDNDFYHIKPIENIYLNEYNLITCGNVNTYDLFIGFIGSSIKNIFLKDCYMLSFENIDKFNNNIFPYFDLKYITGNNLNYLYFNKQYKTNIKIFDMCDFYCNDKNRYTIHNSEQSWI